MISNSIFAATAAGLTALAPAPATTPGANVAKPAASAAAEGAATTGALRVATEADVKVGAAVNSKDGIAIGKIASVDATGAVIEAGSVKAKVSLSGIGVGANGLLIGMTKAEFDAATTKKAS